MKRRTLIWIGMASIAFLTVDTSFGVTIPAGTPLVVRTLHGISSIDAPGTRFPAQLTKDVVVNGKVVLPVGTKVSGQVATSKRTHTSSQRLSVNITDVQVGGRSLPIKTAGAVDLENNAYQTRRGVSVSKSSYQVPSGRKIEFRLAQPLNL
jgi:hypothetical protein